MYTENKPMTSRERINDVLLRRALEAQETSIQTANMPSNKPNIPGLENLPLASVYSPVQAFKELYELENGFEKGTIFKELDFPFLCGEKGGNCRGK